MRLGHTSAGRSDRRPEGLEPGLAVGARLTAQAGDPPILPRHPLDWESEPLSPYRHPLPRLIPLHRRDGSLFEMSDCFG